MSMWDDYEGMPKSFKPRFVVTMRVDGAELSFVGNYDEAKNLELNVQASAAAIWEALYARRMADAGHEEAKILLQQQAYKDLFSDDECRCERCASLRKALTRTECAHCGATHHQGL